jgi:diguanylate cyclase (GGDEF)-like protein
MRRLIHNSSWLSISLFIAAMVCIAAFKIINAEVDPDGYLREPFFLLGLAVLFLGLSALEVAVVVILRIADTRNIKIVQIDDDDQDAYFKAYFDERNRRTLPYFIGLSCFGLLAFSVNDLLTIPQYWSQFFVFRIIICLVGVLGIWFVKKGMARPATALNMFALGSFSLFAYGASLVTDHSLLLTWNLTISVGGFFWPLAIVTFRPFSNFLLVVFFVLVYTVSFAANSSFDITDLAINGGIFLACTLVISVILQGYKLSMLRELSQLQFQVECKSKDIERQRQMLEFQATYDALTGAFSRWAGLERLEDRIHLSARKKTPLALVFIDVDNLKETNDHCGHKEGDRLIKEVSSVLANAIRNVDVLCRLGGDEFFVALNECDVDQAKAILDRADSALSEKASNFPFPLEMSWGVVAYDLERNEQLDEFLERADKAMYEVKNQKKSHRASMPAKMMIEYER